jgi:hypothetical protein
MNSNYKTYLHFVVPYEERERAKSNGLHWRTDTKTWYLSLTQQQIDSEEYRPICELWRLRFISGGSNVNGSHDLLETKCREIYTNAEMKREDELNAYYDDLRQKIYNEINN